MRSFVASVSVVVRRRQSRVAQDAVKGCRLVKSNSSFWGSFFFWWWRGSFFFLVRGRVVPTFWGGRRGCFFWFRLFLCFLGFVLFSVLFGVMAPKLQRSPAWNKQDCGGFRHWRGGAAFAAFALRKRLGTAMCHLSCGERFSTQICDCLPRYCGCSDAIS